jgi:hypothetical protein
MKHVKLTQVTCTFNPRQLDLLTTWTSANAPDCPRIEEAVPLLVDRVFEGSHLHVVTNECHPKTHKAA